MSTNTATVETLTAEVQALMIGSRQVTLSVYRQLDEVPWDENFSPFGRVRDKEDEKRIPPDEHDQPVPYPIFGVGRSVGGQLVRAVLGRPENISYSDEFEHWWFHHTLGTGSDTVIVAEGRYKVRFRADLAWEGSGKADVRQSALRTSSCCTNVKAIAERSPVAGMDQPYIAGEKRDTFIWLAAEYNHRWLTGEFCPMHGLERAWRYDAKEWLDTFTAMADRYRAAEALPLIVLAGMR